MISQIVIQDLARRHQTTELNIAREYCQHLFLAGFYQQESQQILFKGGTALRIIYSSPRFSADLDFTGVDVPAGEIDRLITHPLVEMKRAGLSVDIEEAKKTSGGYLGAFVCRFASYQAAIQIEVSLRKKGAVTPQQTIIAGDFIPPYTILHLPEEVLIREKIEACLARARPRDFFDIYFILRKNFLPQELKGHLGPILRKLKSMNLDFKKELRAFLPRGYYPLISNFSETLQKELERHA